MELVSCMRRYLGMNVVRVLQRELGATPVPGASGNIECRILSEEQVLGFAFDPQLELSPCWIRNAYAHGGVCVGALERSRLVGYTWLAFEDTQYTAGVWIGLDAKYRYSYKSFVRPAYRGQRIAQALHALADDPSLRRGRRFAVNFVDLDNHRSIAALQRAGSRSIGYAAYAKCFGVVLALRSPALRRAGVRFYGSTPRRIAARMRAWPTPTPGSSV
jgi:GNAT superfamily N-acetyltransferase